MVTVEGQAGGYTPEQVRQVVTPLPFGSLAAAAYETLYGAATWYRENVVVPFSQTVYNDPGVTFRNPAANPAAHVATHVVALPATVTEGFAASIAGAPMLYEEMKNSSGQFNTERATEGFTMQARQFQEDPAGFTVDLIGSAVLLHGATKAAGVASKASPVRIRTAEIPTGGSRINPYYSERVPAVINRVAGIEKEIPVTNRYSMITVERPGSLPTEGRIVAGVARTVEGTAEGARKTEVFTGSPGAIMERTTIATKAPLDVTNPQPWSKGQSLLMRDHMERTASPEVQTLVNEGQNIHQAAQSAGVRAAVDQQIHPFDLNLETFGGPGGAGNRAIVQVLSQEKYRGRVVTGGSIIQKAYILEGGFKDVSFSDVDIWVRDAATGRELYGDLTAALERERSISYDPILMEGGKTAQTHLSPRGSFEILGTGEGRGIGAHTFEQFPQVEGTGRLVKTAYGGTIEITNPVYALKSKIGGAFKGITYKPGEKTTLLIDRAKDIPDISAYSRQGAANLYDSRIGADVLSVQTLRREKIAASYERMSDAARRYGLDLEKTRQGSMAERAKNLKPDEIGSGITVGQKVKQTLTREITVDVLKGNPREVRSGVDIFGIREGRGQPRGLGDDAVLFRGRRYVPGARRVRVTDIYPAGRAAYPASRSGNSGTYAVAVLAVASRYPKGTYPATTRTRAYPGEGYPARKTEGGGSYPAKTGGGGKYTGGGGGGDDGYTGGGSSKDNNNYPFMGPAPYPKGPYPTTTPPPPTEIPRERNRTRFAALTASIPARKRRKEDESLLTWHGAKERKTAPYLEEAPVASHLEVMKGITNAKRHRKAGK